MIERLYLADKGGGDSSLRVIPDFVCPQHVQLYMWVPNTWKHVYLHTSHHTQAGGKRRPKIKCSPHGETLQ